MAVVAAAVADGQGIGVGTKGDGGKGSGQWSVVSGQFGFPNGYDTPAADMGVDLVGVEALQMLDNCIVGILLATRRLRMLMKVLPYFLIINHNLFFSQSEPKELSEILLVLLVLIEL